MPLTEPRLHPLPATADDAPDDAAATVAATIASGAPPVAAKAAAVMLEGVHAVAGVVAVPSVSVSAGKGAVAVATRFEASEQGTVCCFRELDPHDGVHAADWRCCRAPCCDCHDCCRPQRALLFH